MDAILFLTHTWSPDIETEFRRLSAIGETEAWIVTDSRNPHVADLAVRFPRCWRFELAGLLRLPYPKLHADSLEGSAHLPLLDFFGTHNDFQNYWVVEYDVRYTGDWSGLFREFGEVRADFVTTHIRSRDEEPYWAWWGSFRRGDRTFKRRDCWRSFNVFYRISASALRFLDHELRLSWRGHHEVLLISLLRRAGFTILDFGGDSAFTPPGMRNRFYHSGRGSDGSLDELGTTLCYRPIRSQPGSLPDKLYHPVKPAGDPGGFLAFHPADDDW
jgi:hypothetical protein